jgi:hypothetical protein
MWIVPILLLILVALHQRWRVATTGQTAWKGGGFGMFSTIPNTIVIAEAAVDAGAGDVAHLRFDIDPSASQVRAVPTEQNLQAWARAVYLVDWERCGQSLHRRSANSRQPRLTILSVTVSRIRMAFHGRSGTYTASPETTITVMPGDGR